MGRKFKIDLLYCNIGSYILYIITTYKKCTYIVSLTNDDQDSNDTKYGSKVIIALDRLPNERLKRNVVRSRMDLIGEYIIV